MKLQNLTTHGKWILTGEHSVILGNPAIVFPIPEMTLCLNWKTHTTFKIDGNLSADLMHKNLKMFTQPYTSDLNYYLHFDNSIPISKGLGFSGALSAILSQWASSLNWINNNQIFNVAKTFENHFHSQSSGLDIIGAMSKSGQIFHQGNTQTLPQRFFHLYLSYTGQKSKTSTCVKQVMSMRNNHLLIDSIMQESVDLGSYAFHKNSYGDLKKCIELGYECFNKWNLIDPSTQNHINELTSLGAAAYKPTGSGLGGYVLSLWEHKPEQNSVPLIPALPSSLG